MTTKKIRELLLKVLPPPWRLVANLNGDGGAESWQIVCGGEEEGDPGVIVCSLGPFPAMAGVRVDDANLLVRAPEIAAELLQERETRKKLEQHILRELDAHGESLARADRMIQHAVEMERKRCLAIVDEVLGVAPRGDLIYQEIAARISAEKE